jgi:hypothetical protein
MKKESKYQMFYRPIGMLESMAIGWEKHKQKYGIEPKRIYVPKETFIIYKSEFDRSHLYPNLIKKGQVFFRGAEVLSQT